MTTTDIIPTPSHCAVTPSAEYPGVMHVEFHWNAELDRPHSYGIACNDRNVTRLIRAFLNGDLFENPQIAFDVNNQSYVAARCRVWGKRINKDLTELGY